jgi:glycerol uptake facilitator-like aquaporin
MMSRFVLGAIVGAIAVWVWGEEIRRFANTKGRTAHLVAADTLQSVQSTAGELFDTAKDQVTSTLQAGQDAIRPARVTRDR